MNEFLRITIRTVLWTLAGLLIILLALSILLRIPSVQNYVVGKVTNYIEKTIETPVRIGYVNITFPKKIVLENVYFEDQKRDTLLAGEKMLVDISLLKLFKNTVEINQLELKGITSKINRSDDGVFNFDYIIDAFSSEGEQKETVEDSPPMHFDIGTVNLDNIKFQYNDNLSGINADISLNHLATKIETFDLSDNMSFALPKVSIKGLITKISQWSPEVEDTIVNLSQPDMENNLELLPNIRLGKLDLSDISVAYQDLTAALDSRFEIDKLSAQIEEIDLNNEWVYIKSLLLDGSDSEVIFGQKNFSQENNSSENDVNWQVKADKLTINQSNFAFRDKNQAPMDGFDYFNIGIQDLKGDLKDLYYSSDSISGSLKALSANDHSGFMIKKLQADFVYTNTGAKITNLHAETPQTLLRDHIEIGYPSLTLASEHPELITIQADIKKSQIDMKDIYYFAPFLDTMEVTRPLMDKKFYIDSKIGGRVDNLNIPKFSFKTLDNTELIASARITGLPDIDNFYIELDIDKLETGKKDLDRLIAKSLLPDSISLPNSIYADGVFNGGLRGFDADIDLRTDLGNASFSGNMDMHGADTSYNALLSISDFDLGKFLNQDSLLGIIAMEADVSGKGIDPKTMNANLKGKVNRFEALSYRYHDLSFEVNALEGDIAANILSPDPNIQFNLDLNADMRSTYPRVNMEWMIDSINLQKLGLIDDNFRYHGKILADLETADIDFLNGKVNIVNSSIAYNQERFFLDTVSLVSEADSNRNIMLLNSEFLTAHLAGKYKLSELNKYVEDILRIYYNPSQQQFDSLDYTPQNFEFSARLFPSRFIRDFFPKLEEMQDITLDGRFDSEDKSIMAKLLAPKVVYDGSEFKDLGADIITVDSTLYYSALLGMMKINNIEMKNSVLSGQVIQNNLDFGLWIKDKDGQEQYHLGAKMAVDDESYKLSLFPNGLMLNYDTWEIDSLNSLSFGKNGIQATNFHLHRGNQAMAIHSQDSIENSPLDLSFENFRIETFSKILESEGLSFGGGINGNATISRLEGSPVFVSDLTIDRFYFGTDTIGNVILKVNNEVEDTFDADIQILGNGNKVSLLGQILVPDGQKPSIKANLDLEPLTMETIQAFSLGNLQKSEGNLTGKLKISGNFDQPRIDGDLLFNNARINASMLNSDLFIDKQKITFNSQGINFRSFEIKDVRNNLAKINGSILTKNYTDYDFNLNINSTDFEVVNSTREDNDLFFGKLFVTSTIRIRGNLDKPVIDGNVKADEKTDFAFIVPNDNPGVTERDGVVKFVDRSDTLPPNVFARLDSMTQVTRLSGFDLALNLQTDKAAKFQIILDEGTEEALHIRGIAELNATIDASDKITMSGTYTVEDGEYTFNFGPVSRKFTFQKGSTITWNGDPLDAQMNITAVYNNKFPTLELVQNQIGSESQNLYKQRIPFDVKLLLNGELFKPDITFDIDLDENNAIVSQDVVSKVNIALSSLREDPAEMNKQVFSLIVLGRFMSANPFESLSGGGGVESAARNTVTSLLNSQLNALASDLIKGVELDFNLHSEQDYLTGSGQNRTDLNIGISKMLFDDRLKITVGSNFEVEGGARPGEKTNNIAGDISLDYQLSKDGRYFARVYRKNQYQATLQGQYVETGIGFVINMNYNKFKELFMSSRALQNYYNPESKGFRRRFDVERMEVDSVYRDSVRQVIRDSLLLHNPKYKERMEKRREEEKRKQELLDSTQNTLPADSINFIPSQQIIRNEEDEAVYHEK